jgi:hypothetical protein
MDCTRSFGEDAIDREDGRYGSAQLEQGERANADHAPTGGDGNPRADRQITIVIIIIPPTQDHVPRR